MLLIGLLNPGSGSASGNYPLAADDCGCTGLKPYSMHRKCDAADYSVGTLVSFFRSVSIASKRELDMA